MAISPSPVAPIPAPTSTGNIPISFENSIKIIGGLLAALVAAYTLVDNSNKSYAAIDQQTRSELDHWEGLRSQYFQILESLGDNFSDPKEAEKLQLDSLCRLAKAAPSTLEGRAVRKIWGIGDTAYKQKKIGEIADARSHLVEIIYKYPPARELPSCSGLFDDLRQDQAGRFGRSDFGSGSPALEGAEAKERVVADTTAINKAVTQAATPVGNDGQWTQVPRGSFTLSTGNASGYDVDVFWCERPLDQPVETQIFLAAEGAAKALTQPVVSLGGAPIGRVRLRALSVEKQLNPGYPSSGFVVRAEQNEKGAGQELAAILSHRASQQPFAVTNSAIKTPWYLSVFVCSAPSKP
jgi:hypothetical protein